MSVALESVSRKILELAPVLGVVALCLEPLSVALGSVSHWIPELELVLGIVFLWCPILGVALGVVLFFVCVSSAIRIWLFGDKEMRWRYDGCSQDRFD